MATNPKVRAALLEKTGWDRKVLSAQVAKKKAQTLMSTPEAVCVLAYEYRVPVEKHLDAGERAHIRQLMQQLVPVAAPARPAKQAPKGAQQSREIVIRFPREFKVKNPLLSVAQLKEAADMASVFPVLHVFENGLRELVRRVMHAKFGKDWFDTELTQGELKGVREKYVRNAAIHQRQNFWHHKRREHPVDYVDLKDLGLIMKKKSAEFFPGIFPDQEWFELLMRELEPSRNVVCHMNPLDDGNIDDVKSWYRKFVTALDNAIARGAIPPEVLAEKKAS